MYFIDFLIREEKNCHARFQRLYGQSKKCFFHARVRQDFHGLTRSWLNCVRRAGYIIWPDMRLLASWPEATFGSHGRKEWRCLMSCSWTPIGLSMPACGCGCRVARSSNSFSTATVPCDLAGRQIRTAIISDAICRCWRIFRPDISTNHGMHRSAYNMPPNVSSVKSTRCRWWITVKAHASTSNGWSKCISS